MWEQIAPADIERAKAAWAAMRDKILARHQEEIKILETDENLLRSLEIGLMAFHQRFMSPPQPAAVGTETPLSSDAPAVANSAPSLDEQTTVVTLPSLSKQDEPEQPEDDRPNFLERARKKWGGMAAGPATKGDLLVGD